MSHHPLPFRQPEPEVWLVLDGARVLARLRAAGPSWMHVYIEGEVPVDSQVPLTVVLRGVEGGVIDGLSEVMSTKRHDGRNVLHLRLLQLRTTGREALLRRFTRDVLNDSGESPLLCSRQAQPVPSTQRSLSALRQVQGAIGVPSSAFVEEDEVITSCPVRWRSGERTFPASIVRCSRSGRRLVVRRSGPSPTTWETVRLELDLGVSGEPRPIQLVAVVVGVLSASDDESHLIIVRLTRWSAAPDRAAWMRWIRHKQRLDTSMGESASPEVTRTVSPLRASAPPT